MGLDGGTIPKRHELCKAPSKPEQKDKESIRVFKLAHCALSQHLLAKPVVACEMGKLYNKEAIIELLLSHDRSQAPVWAKHIEKLKDVVELDLTPNPAYQTSPAYLPNQIRRQDTIDKDKLCSMFMCPITGLEMNGSFRFFFAFSTGKVVSERAIKVLQKDPEEKDRYKEEDLVLINPADEEIDEQQAAMVVRRAKAKAARKAAKKGAFSSTFKTPNVPIVKTDNLGGWYVKTEPSPSVTDKPLAKMVSIDLTAKDKGKMSRKDPIWQRILLLDAPDEPPATELQTEQKQDALQERDRDGREMHRGEEEERHIEEERNIGEKDRHSGEERHRREKRHRGKERHMGERDDRWGRDNREERHRDERDHREERHRGEREERRRGEWEERPREREERYREGRELGNGRKGRM